LLVRAALNRCSPLHSRFACHPRLPALQSAAVKQSAAVIMMRGLIKAEVHGPRQCGRRVRRLASPVATLHRIAATTHLLWFRRDHPGSLEIDGGRDSIRPAAHGRIPECPMFTPLDNSYGVASMPGRSVLLARLRQSIWTTNVATNWKYLSY